jgi:hypothetical protein
VDSDLLLSDRPVSDRSATATGSSWARLGYAVYGLCIAMSIATWFLAIGAPLWLDETGSYWIVEKGFRQIAPRLSYYGHPAYYYILWLATKVLGTSEMALRVPSVLAMLGAAWLLYLAAREMFERDLALIAVVVFCLHPIVLLESVDARPYAFATLATCAAILAMVRLRRSDSMWLAALAGVLAALAVWFHLLFGAILPALAVCFFVLARGERKARWRQFGVGLAAFLVAFLPVLPELAGTFRTRATHVFEAAPGVGALLWTVAPVYLPYILIATALVVAFINRHESRQDVHFERWKVLTCFTLGLAPLLMLYGLSVGTPLHVFVARHRLVAIPGIALCWALALSPFRSRGVRLGFCVVLVVLTAGGYFRSPESRQHNYTWKYALEAAQKDASADNAPVLICSDFPESDYIRMPVEGVKESRYFAQLSYYKLTVPVVPLPQDLNAEAKSDSESFLEQAALKHERFLAVGNEPSYGTLDWLAKRAGSEYSARVLGVFSKVKVMEFTPRGKAGTGGA